MTTNSDDADVRELQVQFDHIDNSLDDLKKTVERGFKGVHDRQDTTNGKVLSNEETLKTHSDEIDTIKEDLGNLEDELKNHRIHTIKNNAQDKANKLKKLKGYKWEIIIGVFLTGIGTLIGYLIPQLLG